MAEIAFILVMVALVIFTIAIVLWVISSFLSEKKRQFIETIVVVTLFISLILLFVGMWFDCSSNNETEYVECEYCGSKVPREEYIEE